MKPQISIAASLLLILFSSRATGVVVNQVPLPHPIPTLSPAQWDAMRVEAERNLEQLRADSKLPPVDPSFRVLFDWPLRPVENLEDYSYFQTLNFVDHDPNYPNHLLDYECGDRSYDNTAGVNHNGTDYILWPFWWYKMDHDQVEVIAATAGTIFDKTDGYDDRSCSPGGTANKVAIRHADGTMAWYLHFKRGSLTQKGIGDAVVAGEYLGIVGSSGNSGLPHLHLDFRDEDWNTFDPYDGPCNPLESGSLWIDQRPYYDSAINAVFTHSSPPVIPPCPEQEILNLRNEFAPSDSVYYGIYHRDILAGQVATYMVIRPNGTIADSGSYSIEDPFYPVASGLGSYLLPDSAAVGMWRISVDYDGRDYEHTFIVGTLANVTEGDIKPTSGIRIVPDPFFSTTSVFIGDARGPARIQVFEPSGKLLRTMITGAPGTERSPVLWDGTDDSGRPLPAGIYYIKVRDRASVRTGRALLLQ